MGEAGFHVTHLYGLTEVYGPAVVNDWHAEWSDLPVTEQASLKARQGVRYHALEGLDVLDPDTMQPVPRDGGNPWGSDVSWQRSDERLFKKPDCQ